MEGFDETKQGNDGQQSEAGAEHAHRIREARRAFKPGGTGHIDFVTRETGTYPPLINEGRTENGGAATAQEWVAMYRATYGYNPEYDAPEDNESEEEFRERALYHAQWAFGKGGQSENLKLLADIQKELGTLDGDNSNTDAHAEVFEAGDPLAGTRYEGVANEDLHYGQSVFGEDGKQHAPNEGDEYRKAFLYYAKAMEML